MSQQQQRNYHFSFLSLCSFHNSSFSKLLNVHLLLFLLFVFPPPMPSSTTSSEALSVFSDNRKRNFFRKYLTTKLEQSYALLFPIHTHITNRRHALPFGNFHKLSTSTSLNMTTLPPSCSFICACNMQHIL